MFCEEAVLQIAVFWPPGHFYTSLESVGISGDNEMLT
jgi:hypothetical protein